MRRSCECGNVEACGVCRLWADPARAALLAQVPDVEEFRRRKGRPVINKPRLSFDQRAERKR
jgi:hypothetical protein